MSGTPRQSIRKRIVRKIVWLVVGHLMLFLLVSGIVGVIRTKSGVLDQLKLQSEAKLALIELRIDALIERTENFAASSAVTKSLIDDSALLGYLPAAVNELGREREVVAVAIVDYSGEVIARSQEHTEISNVLDLRGTLSRGRRSLAADHSSIFVVAPVSYYGTPQGAVIVELDLSPTLIEISESPEIDHVELTLGGGVAFRHEDSDGKLLTFDLVAGHEFPNLQELGAKISLGRGRDRAMAPVMSSLKESAFIGLIAIIASILLAMKMGSQIAAPILLLAEKVRDSSQRCFPTHTNDELEALALAFDEQTQQIMDAKDELEDRVERRTKSLAENAEKLKRSNEELDDFAHIASHDLKEPLRGIHNYASFLLEDYRDKLDEDGASKLETLKSLSQRMEQLINDLLYFSQVGRVDLAMGTVNMNAVVHEVCESLAISISDANIEIRLPQELPDAYCDEIRIAEVFRNFITNAIKYNNKPERWIELGCELHAPTEGIDHEHLAFYVRDNGIGIRPKHLDAVFKMFRRLHGREKFGGGHGVGLSIIKKVVERHHGEIWVESEYGEGTTFWFTVPSSRT